MDFTTSTKILKNTYKLFEKFNLEHFLPLDTIILDRCPEMVSRLQSYCNFKKIALFATNGKKTTLSLFNQILKTNNHSFVTNLSDNSELYCTITALISNLAPNFEKKDYYTFALDEYELLKSFDYTKFDYLLLSNIFDSQTDFLSLEQKRQKLNEALILNPDINLVINADEPMFFDIKEAKNKFYYGFDDIEFALMSKEDLSQKNDILLCKNCARALNYKKKYYSHIGDYSCKCSMKRPELHLSAKAKIYNDCTYLDVFYKGTKMVFKVPIGGLYNAYNALGAIALAINLGTERKVITDALSNYKPIKFRDEVINYQDKKVKLKIIKNPTSLSESIRELYGTKNTKVVFCLNDDKLDGVDTSWIFDANFESLKDFKNKIYITAPRCDDMALKLKYSGVNPCYMLVDSKIKSAINCCYWDLEENENMLILLTPSLEDKVFNILKK